MRVYFDLHVFLQFVAFGQGMLVFTLVAAVGADLQKAKRKPVISLRHLTDWPVLSD